MNMERYNNQLKHRPVSVISTLARLTEALRGFGASKISFKSSRVFPAVSTKKLPMISYLLLSKVVADLQVDDANLNTDPPDVDQIQLPLDSLHTYRYSVGVDDHGDVQEEKVEA
jgi:hypothetical protein